MTPLSQFLFLCLLFTKDFFDSLLLGFRKLIRKVHFKRQEEISKALAVATGHSFPGNPHNVVALCHLIDIDRKLVLIQMRQCE